MGRKRIAKAIWFVFAIFWGFSFGEIAPEYIWWAVVILVILMQLFPLELIDF